MRFSSRPDAADRRFDVRAAGAGSRRVAVESSGRAPAHAPRWERRAPVLGGSKLAPSPFGAGALAGPFVQLHKRERGPSSAMPTGP